MLAILTVDFDPMKWRHQGLQKTGSPSARTSD
jgi:hypothetical protein